ncbi:hypothetical protein ACFO5T_05900 [Dokdonia genika]|uniref:DUF4878 domain-containing protein n=1 Tax=Dokdonia genika TaxID=308113 RepID=A0ABV9L8G6_9FLAO
MKTLATISIVLLLISCTETETLSPAETAKVVAESFYHGDMHTLKKYTTAEGYTNLASIQELLQEDKNSPSDFKVIDEAVVGEIVWIKYTTTYDAKPSIFKLIKENNVWKVTHNGPRDKGPF